MSRKKRGLRFGAKDDEREFIKKEEAASNDPRIIFENGTFEKFQHYIHSVDTEISGFGKVTCDSTGAFRITDLCLLKQEVSGADTELQQEDIAAFMFELHRRGEKASDWRFWWHSHVNMAVFWSSTDEAAMSPENNIGKPWLLSVVGNKKGELLGRLDVYSPVHLVLDKMTIETGVSRSIPQEIQDEVAAKVHKRTWSTGNYQFPQYNRLGFDTRQKSIYDNDPDEVWVPKQWESVEDSMRSMGEVKNVPEGEQMYYEYETGKEVKVSAYDLYCVDELEQNGGKKLNEAEKKRARYLLDKVNL